MPKGEGKEFKGRLAVELLSLNAVDMREDYVSSVLRKSVKTASLGQDIAKERMVFLNTRLLVSLVGSQKKSEVSLVSSNPVSRVKTSENSPPLSVSTTGNSVPKHR